MRVSRWTTGIVLLLCCTRCIEPYEPDIEADKVVMVFDAEIMDAQDPQFITISRSSPYNDRQFSPVTGCVVRVENDQGAIITFQDQGEGLYRWDPLPGFMEEGNAYKLTVETPEDGMYESEYDTLTVCAPIDRLNYEMEIQGASSLRHGYFGLRFYVDMKGNPEESRYYMWTFEETWEYHAYYPIQYIWDGDSLYYYTPPLEGVTTCYMTGQRKDMQVGSSGLSGNNEILQLPLLFVSNQTPRLQYQYSLLVTQHSLSQQAFDYWDRMKSQSDEGAGLFEAQPSSTTGNMCSVDHPEEKVLGYFHVSQVTQKRINVRDTFEIPIAKFDCPQDTAYGLEDFSIAYPYFFYSISKFGPGPPWVYSFKKCHDCTYRGGVTEKPEYWDDLK